MLDGSKYQQARTVLNYSWIILLVAVAKANIDISTGEITIATTSSTTSITTKPFVYIHDVSYEADNSTYDFQLTLSAAEILNLSAIRQDVDFQNSSTLYLLPSAEFSYCVDTNQATGLDARVEIKQDGTAGFADGNSVINAYAVLAGNGSATGGNQEILFGSDVVFKLFVKSAEIFLLTLVYSSNCSITILIKALILELETNFLSIIFILAFV